MKTNIFLILIGAMALSLGATPVKAQQNVDELKSQIQALQNRVEQLESERAAAPEPSGPSAAQQTQSDDWTSPGFDRWDPLDEMNRMQQEMNRVFRHAFSSPTFSRAGGSGGIFQNNMFYDDNFDVKESAAGYQITLDTSGFDTDKIDISVHEKILTISGQMSSEQKESGNNSFTSAQSFGSFLKTLPLPDDADTQKMKTTRDGQRLVINIPKKA